MRLKRSQLVTTAILVGLFAFLSLADCAETDRTQRPSAISHTRPTRLPGYLSATAALQPLVFVPAPPKAGSAAFAQDEEMSRKGLGLQGSARWRLAADDAELSFPGAALAFSCAMDALLSEEETPRLLTLMRRSMTDTSRSVRIVKNHYMRPRPFMENKKPICTPLYQAQLEGNGSYPSGHAAIGWAWALILSEIAPEKADEILARGRAFGESRIVCNVHWQSDVVEGRVVAAGTVARLHADPAFRADLEAAKGEIARIRGKGLRPTRSCSEEAAALAVELVKMQ